MCGQHQNVSEFFDMIYLFPYAYKEKAEYEQDRYDQTSRTEKESKILMSCLAFKVRAQCFLVHVVAEYLSIAFRCGGWSFQTTNAPKICSTLVAYSTCAVLWNESLFDQSLLVAGTKLAQAAKFNNPNDPCKIMVATDAIGMGLNL